MAALKIRHPSEISEEEVSALVFRAQAGDADAFTELLCQLERKLHRQALFLARDEHQALDLLQETLLECWKHLDRYDGRVRFATWVCALMLHRHYSFLRRLRVRSFIQFTKPPEPASSAPEPDESSYRREQALLMRECLDALPARQRLVIYLRFYAGESLEGIAAAVPCSLGTVKSRLFHGLARLAKMQKLKELRHEL